MASKGWIIRGNLYSKGIFEKYCYELNRKAYNSLMMLEPLGKSALILYPKSSVYQISILKSLVRLL